MNMMITTAIALFAGLMMTRFFKALHLQFGCLTLISHNYNPETA